MKMTYEELELYRETYSGYCSHCDKVTMDDGVEPDAEDYVCPECNNSTIMGIENALLQDNLIIVEERRF